MKTKEIKFVIFDSLRSVHCADENSSKEMQGVMDLLKRITREGFTVLVTHHNRKKSRQPGAGSDDLGEDARGSSAISGALHGHLSCESVQKDEKPCIAFYQRKLKCDKKLEPFLLGIDADENRFGFSYLGDYKQAEKALQKTMSSIFDIISKSDKWLSVRNFVDVGVGGDKTVRKALSALVKAGQAQTKERQELIRLGVSMFDSQGKHNEKLYYRMDEIESADGMF